ncbi:Membrane-bound lytic murein transglycosylase D [Aquicella siphonis]|uniref:Membrane-bound lytic murein transglycosylase D n=1 Tax=Aquicella siphonis TaxID=254247 RepID=A0A5E4PJD3_9COXI|nr:transglycosylase SLT domain-containing protein [Aquicella siphonis]VVC77189.1 Membrane-bound lytic murein transglycosylase D [Aquicella siphonis]
MQLIINLSKFIFLAVLSCTLLITWYGEETEVINLVPNYYGEAAGDDASDSIWNTMRSEFRLDSRTQSAQVQAEIRKMIADPVRLYNILKASVPYIYFIHEQTEARGLPAELALIPVIESEYNPNDRSNKGATGLWQLMSQTAHELGVKVKSGYDGRRNVIASTKAALAYFNDLGQYFNGNWYLAIAAYNCGQERVKSAVRRAGTDSFWSLPLPKETKYYVPRLLAVAAIVKDPKKYGVELPPVSNKPYFEEVKVAKPVSLDKVARTAGVNIETLNRLNPDYTHGSTPKSENATLLVPVEKAPVVKAQLGA